MEGPPRVFSLIKMSVKSLPCNQEPDSLGSPCTPVTLQPESMTPQKIKKARQVTAYLCSWRVESATLLPAVANPSTSARSDCQCVCALERDGEKGEERKKQKQADILNATAEEADLAAVSPPFLSLASDAFTPALEQPRTCCPKVSVSSRPPRFPTSPHPTPLCTRASSEGRASASLGSRGWVSRPLWPCTHTHSFMQAV